MEDFNQRVKKIIHFFVAIFIITLIVIIIGLLMLKYNVEGENNMPFELSQMVIVSTAEGTDIEGDKIWNFALTQNNDIYLNISKNKEYKDTEIIKSVEIKNFQVVNEPEKGEIYIYKPSENDGNVYENIEENEIEELMYLGNEVESLKDLQIANQGGVISFRCANQDLRRIFI